MDSLEDSLVASFDQLDIDQFDLETLVDMVTGNKFKNIICMVGAGMSTAAGIPDFRSSKGLYQQELNVPYPEAIFELDYFVKNPKPFFKLATQLYGTYLPTRTHYFLKLLQVKGILKRIYTQNIDALERLAGINEELLVECHGTFATSTCIKCTKTYDTYKSVVPVIERDEIPYCSCGGVIKPDIVFFGENLPSRFFELRKVDFMRCDLLIIIGTSLVVQPFASLAKLAKCPRVLVNMESVGEDIGIGNSKRDYKHLSKCDVFVDEFIKLMKWDQDFMDILAHRDTIILSNTLKDEDNENNEEIKVTTERKLSIPSDVSCIFTASEITEIAYIDSQETSLSKEVKEDEEYK